MINLILGVRVEWRTHMLLVRLEWGKGAARSPKFWFCHIRILDPFIQLMQSGPLRAWTNLAGSTDDVA